MEQREQNDNKHSERKKHINAVIKRSDAMRETERDIRSAYEEFMEKGDEETRKVLHENIMAFCNVKVRRLAYNAGGKVSPEDVEDVVNESCKAMLEGLDKHRSENEYIENIMGYISNVCRNQFANLQRERFNLRDPETGGRLYSDIIGNAERGRNNACG